MIARLIGVLTLALLALPAQAQDIFTPRDAIVRAADEAPWSVRGIFVMPVRATGTEPGFVYLNSEDDYRDQRNLTIVIPARVAAALQEKYGEAPETFFKGKRVAVTGAAKRIKIVFTWEGHRTKKYYYQTHVLLTEADKLQVLQ